MKEIMKSLFFKGLSPVVSVCLISLCALFYFLRAPSITLDPALYAEDGSIFLQAAINSGFASLFETYAGYSHLLQRLVALFAVQYLSPAQYPSFFLAAAWACYLLPLVCMEVLVNNRIYGRILRVSYFPYVIYPYAAETYLNLPNSYIFFPLGFILIAYGVYGNSLEDSQLPYSRIGPFFQLLLLLYGLAAVLTGPFAALYTIPLLIYVAIRRRSFPWRPFWLTLPVLLSPLQLYLSQLSYNYPLTSGQALSKLLSRPDVLLDWFAIHMISPLYGGYIPGRHIRVMQQPLKVLLLLAMAAVVILAVSVVVRRFKANSLLYLAIFSTLLLSFSSLLVTVRRGAPLSHLVIEDGGGRFFFWNTVFFLSILLTAFVLLLFNPLSLRSPVALIIASWFVIAGMLYHNNISARSFQPSYSSQLAMQCLSRQSIYNKIVIFPGSQWGFNLAKPQIDKLCSSPSPQFAP